MEYKLKKINLTYGVTLQEDMNSIVIDIRKNGKFTHFIQTRTAEGRDYIWNGQRQSVSLHDGLLFNR